MPEVKRLNYFTSQFLVEKDFKDEQAYHVEMRRRHNQALHLFGIAKGLEVSKTGDRQVSVSPGVAIDKDGREIVLSADAPVDLTRFGANATVFLTLQYQEVFDPADRYQSGGVDNFTRTTERPKLDANTAVPPTDGSVIALTQVKLDGSGNVSSIDPSVRKFASAVIAPASVNTSQLVDGAVTTAKIADGSVGTTKIADAAIIAAKIADGIVGTTKIADNAINTNKIADNSVNTNKIVDNAINTNKIADNAINAAKILDGSVGTAELANNAVTVDKILNATITAAKIAPGVIPANIGIAVSPALSNGQTIPPPNGFAANECVFFAFAKTFSVPSGGGQFSVFADNTGKITASAPAGGSIVVAGVAIAKKGGW